ncbi:MAG: cell wall-active antibiotics response protein [Alistipes sp.]|jgi:hypothetical protein|nr:cell wall-active antibiotics response protein [Alistipes sp.]
MEIIEKKNDSGRTGILGVLLLAAGLALLCWSLLALPSSPAWGFPWEFTLAVASFLPIAAGGGCLNTVVMRRRNPSYRYGRDRHGDHNGTVTFALLIIAAGAVLLGFNSGVLAYEWRRVFFSWQMLLLVVAMAEYARGGFTGASVLLAVGGFFIIRRLAPLYPDLSASGAGDSWWPVLLIVAGILILGSIFFKRPCRGGWYENCHHVNHGNRADCTDKDRPRDRGTRASGVINTEVVFGGCEQVYLDPVFQGGKIASVFGGVKLDLRRTSLPEGDTWLTVESVFGGVEIDAPEDWIVEIRSESFFGGFDDKRLPPLDGNYIEDRKLIIKVSCVFGGGEIK